MSFVNWFLSQFCRKAVSAVLEDEHHQACLDRIEAERALDHWTSKVGELRQRIPRLEQQIISAKAKESGGGNHLSSV